MDVEALILQRWSLFQNINNLHPMQVIRTLQLPRDALPIAEKVIMEQRCKEERQHWDRTVAKLFPHDYSLMREGAENIDTPKTDEPTHALPTARVKCPKCSHKEAVWWMRQLRAADESEVRFFRCTKCNHTWREYD